MLIECMDNDTLDATFKSLPWTNAEIDYVKVHDEEIEKTFFIAEARLNITAKKI